MNIHRIAGAAMIVARAGRTVCAEEAALPMSVLTEGARVAECDEEIKADSAGDASDLGGGQSLVEVRCWRAAYQAGSIFFAVPANAPDKARLLQFPLPKSKAREAAKPALSLTDADFDPATKIMRSHHKDRGVGDCGTIGEWRWSGSDFQLVRYWSKPKCDGQPFEDTRRWQEFTPRR